MPSPYLAHADAQGRLCGLPPCCVLSWGMICSATLMCGVIALSRHVGLLSQDPLLPSCDPLLLAKAPGLQLKMKVFPGAIKAMGALAAPLAPRYDSSLGSLYRSMFCGYASRFCRASVCNEPPAVFRAVFRLVHVYTCGSARA